MGTTRGKRTGVSAEKSADGDGSEPKRRLQRSRDAQCPHARTAILADARIAAAYRGEGGRAAPGRAAKARQVLRLMWCADGFFALVCYRLRTHLRVRGVPVLPRLLHHLSVITGQIDIGDPPIVHAGVYVPHGQVVIDGLTEVHPGVVLYPFVNLGLLGPDITGPTIERDVFVGTGAKILGPTRVGRGARIGANAVVLHDVPQGATAVGVPARAV